MYVLVDEVANPLLKFTPPPQKYPLVTHLRGLAGHFAYGLGLAAGVEAGWRLLGAVHGEPARRLTTVAFAGD